MLIINRIINILTLKFIYFSQKISATKITIIYYFLLGKFLQNHLFSSIHHTLQKEPHDISTKLNFEMFLSHYSPPDTFQQDIHKFVLNEGYDQSFGSKHRYRQF